MYQFGGKSKVDSKRHFTVVMGGKEHGLYVSSTPSSAARKAVTKLCTANKSKKVEFSIREITQGSKKKTYGPYEGYIEKLKEPIELKGRVIKYKPVAKLSAKKGVQKGGAQYAPNNYIDIRCQDVGEGPTLKSASVHAKEAKQILETDQFLNKYIKTIEINDKFLRIHLTEEGQQQAEFVRTKASGIFGCRSKITKNTYIYKNGKNIFTPPNSNFSKTWE